MPETVKSAVVVAAPLAGVRDIWVGVVYPVHEPAGAADNRIQNAHTLHISAFHKLGPESLCGEEVAPQLEPPASIVLSGVRPQLSVGSTLHFEFHAVAPPSRSCAVPN